MLEFLIKSSPISSDTDSDGIPDGVELESYDQCDATNPLVSDSSLDGNVYTNLQEYQARTNTCSPGSKPREPQPSITEESSGGVIGN